MTTINLGKALVKQLLDGKAYGTGKFSPPGSYDATVNAFSYFESSTNQGAIFKVEYTIDETRSGGHEWTKGQQPYPTVEPPGDERVQLMMMKHQPAAGDVANFVSAALGVWLEMGAPVPWQDPEVLDTLLEHFGIDKAQFDSIRKEDERHLAKGGALLGALIDPENQVFSGVKLRLNTTEKLTKANKQWVVVCRWDLIS
jgi:hypothetical protein